MDQNRITINSRELSFTPNETILSVAKRNNIFIPTLCHLKGAQPTGACRICLVEIKGARGLSPSCTMPAAKGMEVYTDSKAVLEARRTILAMLLKSGNHNCAAAGRSPAALHPISKGSGSAQAPADYAGQDPSAAPVMRFSHSQELCPAHSACKLQALAYRYQVDTSDFDERPVDIAVESAGPLIVRDLSRCILCGRCVAACNEIQVNRAIFHGYRGAKYKIITMGDQDLQHSECVYCGECIQACPVGALMEKQSRYTVRPWETRHVRTTCYYCSTGCQMDLHIKNNEIVKITGAENALPNLGRLCMRGRFGFGFLKSDKRITSPLKKEGSKFREITWDHALELIAMRITQIKSDQSPSDQMDKNRGMGQIVGLGSAKLTNENLYLMQKLFRSVVGNNQISSPLGCPFPNSPLGEIEQAKYILLICSDITNENPVAGTFVKRAVMGGTPLVVIHSMPTKIETFAGLGIRVKKETQMVLVNHILGRLYKEKDKGNEKFSEYARQFPKEAVSSICGVTPADMDRVMDLFGTGEEVTVICGPGMDAEAAAFEDFQEMCPSLGKNRIKVYHPGALNNSHGAWEMGMTPDHFPGYQPVDSQSERQRFESAWHCALNDRPGLSFDELMQDSVAQVKLLYLAGDPLAVDSTPAAGSLSDAGKKLLESAGFVIVQDFMESPSMAHADLVLPALAWAEEEGSFTNCEGRIARVKKAVCGPPKARSHAWIFTGIARLLGHDWPERTSQEIWDNEIIKLIPGLSGISFQNLSEEEDVRPTGKARYPKGSVKSCHRTGAMSLERMRGGHHHRRLMAQCDDLPDLLPPIVDMGNRFIPSPSEIEERFVKLLKAEDKTTYHRQIDAILEKGRMKRGSLIMVLQQIQGIIGFLPVSVQNYVGLKLNIPPSVVFGVVSFYSFFNRVPKGKHTIRICLGTACFVNGSGQFPKIIKEKLGIDMGQTTEDRQFSLDVVRCVGACGLAPVMVVDDETHKQVKAAKLGTIIDQYRQPSADQEG